MKKKPLQPKRLLLLPLAAAVALSAAGCGAGELLADLLGRSSSEQSSSLLQDAPADSAREDILPVLTPDAAGQQAPEAETPPAESTPEPALSWWETEEYADYLPEGPSLFVNRAEYYYYYTVLTEEEQRFYDAMQLLLQDPTSADYRKRVPCSADPSSEEFHTLLSRAYQALLYDHPEYFWLHDYGNFSYYYHQEPDPSGSYICMLHLNTPYVNYEAEMTAFNAAADAFLAQIDLSQEQPQIALQIHDRLIDTVTYDDLLRDRLLGGEEDAGFDLGYTAYGALVANSRGEPNTAVCDGYSYAYEYLLQQAGIAATRVGGWAGDAGTVPETHSWNLVRLDGEWYETDITWDDVEQVSEEGAEHSEAFAAAYADPYFWGRIRHYMFQLTTPQMSWYEPDDSYTYYGDGWYITFLSASAHTRYGTDGTDANGDLLSRYAPEAAGTAFTYDALVYGVPETGEESGTGTEGSY